MLVRVQEADFSPGEMLDRLAGQGAGGIASFLGVVRQGEPPIEAMTLEHYPGMTERALARFAGEAVARFALLDGVVLHRVGRLLPGERIVFVAAAAAHRQPALDAVGFLIDWLKTAAPFWKKEQLAGGAARWVAARPGDTTAAARWR